MAVLAVAVHDSSASPPAPAAAVAGRIDRVSQSRAVIDGGVTGGLRAARPVAARPAGAVPVPTPPVVGPVLAASPPQSITIPKIGVRTGFVGLGLAADDTVEVPKRYDIAGWYTGSPTPGQLGPAIVLGHVDSTRGPGVFYRLGELAPGDRVQIGRRDGSTASFEVTGVRRYSKTAFPTIAVYGNTDHAALRLITCGGAFDRKTGHYADNTIAFARLVASSGAISAS